MIYAAPAGDLAIAGTKLGASLYSSAMPTEATHSFVPAGNQGLLLLGPQALAAQSR